MKKSVEVREKKCSGWMDKQDGREKKPPFLFVFYAKTKLSDNSVKFCSHMQTCTKVDLFHLDLFPPDLSLLRKKKVCMSCLAQNFGSIGSKSINHYMHVLSQTRNRLLVRPLPPPQISIRGSNSLVTSVPLVNTTLSNPEYPVSTLVQNR
jgi:hypothetical protein